MATEAQIYDALSTVYDTCSLFNGTNLNIVEMGLVHDVEQEGSTIRVRLLLTDPMCLYQFEMRAQIIEALAALPAVEAVHVEPIAGKLWWPERMTHDARARLERVRLARRERLGIAAPLGSAIQGNRGDR
jgi:metal-sulfur cluster biosynthetic enzyme